MIVDGEGVILRPCAVTGGNANGSGIFGMLQKGLGTVQQDGADKNGPGQAKQQDTSESQNEVTPKS